MGYIQGAALSSIEICWIFDLSNSVVRCVSDKQDNHHRGVGKETIDSFRMKYKKTNRGESSMLASQSIFLFYFPFFYLTFGFQFDIWPSVPRDLFDFSFLMGFPRDWIERNQSLSICFFFIYIKQSKTLFNAALHYINKVQKSAVFQNVSRVIFIYYYFFFLLETVRELNSIVDVCAHQHFAERENESVSHPLRWWTSLERGGREGR